MNYTKIAKEVLNEYFESYREDLIDYLKGDFDSLEASKDLKILQAIQTVLEILPDYE